MQNSIQSTAAAIREHMPIVCSDGGKFGEVDHVEGNYVKVTRENAAHDGKHHWFPLTWVTEVDNRVHVDRPGDRAMKEWMSADPNQA